MSFERWLALAIPLAELYQNEVGEEFAEKRSVLLATLERHVRQFMLPMNKELMQAIGSRGDWSLQIQPFGRFSEVMAQAARITNMTYESQLLKNADQHPYALAALAYTAASKFYSDWDLDRANHYLGEAIRLYPSEAAPYYFRARWALSYSKMEFLLQKGAIINEPRPLATWISDLRIASSLSPTWKEPQELLKQIIGTA